MAKGNRITLKRQILRIDLDQGGKGNPVYYAIWSDIFFDKHNAEDEQVKPTRTWILIANGARAHILLNDGPGHGVKALKEFEFHGSNMSNQEINSDRPGRSFDSAGDGRHAMEPTTDPHRHEAREFATMLAGVLLKQYEKQVYDRLILVASPAALGDLRTKLPQALKPVITGEIAKDLTHIPIHEIAPYLSHVLAV